MQINHDTRFREIYRRRFVLQIEKTLEKRQRDQSASQFASLAICDASAPARPSRYFNCCTPTSARPAPVSPSRVQRCSELRTSLSTPYMTLSEIRPRSGHLLEQLIKPTPRRPVSRSDLLLSPDQLIGLDGAERRQASRAPRPLLGKDWLPFSYLWGDGEADD
jgi:hypothetical protein